MKKVISKIITFLFVIGIAISGFGGSAYAADSTSTAAKDVSITKDRLAGNDRIETSLKISQSGWKDGADTVVIAQGYGYADALCAAPLAKKNNAPIILSRQDSLSDNTISEIKRLKAKKAFVIGGTASLSSNVEYQLKSLGISDTERLGGADRYETSVKIAKELGSADSIVVTSGAGYADSLSIAPVAAAKSMPILLTRSNSLPDVVNNYIKGINLSKTYVVGGTAVIEDSLKNSLPNAQRLGGTTRFDTNLAILQNFKSDLDFDNVYIAEGNGPNGDEFADALSGSVLAAQKSAPLVLIYKTIATDTANFIKSNMSDKTVLTALGGTLVVPDTILSGIENLYNGKTSGEGIGDPTTPSNPSTGGGGGAGGGTSGPDSNHVSLVIDGYKGNIVNESSLSFTKGDTVFDVLKKTLGDKIKYTGEGGTTYVQAIWDRNGNCEREFDRPQGKDEDGKDRPNQSGWKYSVDDTFLGHSCGAQEATLQGGEKIHWIYVVNAWDEKLFRDVDSVKLNKNSLNLNINGSETLTAAVSPSNATDKDIVWNSSNESVAKVDASTGKVTAVGSGTAVITAESIDNTKGFTVNYDASKNKDTCTVTVSGSGSGGGSSTVPVTGVTLDETGSVSVGNTLQLNGKALPDNASNKGLAWSSSDDTIAAVTQNGLVTGVKEGTAIITVKTADGGKTAACTVTVNVAVTDVTLDKQKITIKNGKMDQLTAAVSPTDATNKNVSWSSSDTSVAAVDETGKITGIAPGKAVITVTTEDGKKAATCNVTVTGLALDADRTVITGKNLQLNALLQTEDDTTKNLIWSSSDDTVAAVDQNGLVTGVSAGTVDIKVTTEDESMTAACTVTVQDAKDYTSDITTLINGISSGATLDKCDEWIALGLNKADKNIPEGYLASLQQKVAENTEDGVLDLGSATDYEKFVLAVLASGGDPENIEGQDLLKYIYNDNMTQGINAYVFGLIALDSKNFDVSDGAKWTRPSLVDAILAKQTPDGGWSYGGSKADPDMTAMVISALEPYKSQDKVKKAVDQGIAVLSDIQDADGGYSSWNVKNSQSSAQVIIGLCANGIDPTTDSRFIKNGNNLMDSLLSFATADKKGFGNSDSTYNSMSTEQGLEALAAYNLFKGEQGSLYSFN